VTDWHIAQVNVGRLIAIPGDLRGAPFMAVPHRVGPATDMQPDPWCVGRA